MNIYEKLINKKASLAVIGLGYVGLPLAINFADKINVIGFDSNIEKINLYKKGTDPTNEMGNERIRNCKVRFTSDPTELEDAMFYIIAVPTPVNFDKTPDLSMVVMASELLGKYMKKGGYVVYESTVYPGVTEEVCIPALEKTSGLVAGVDFKVGYSPERINPGDKIHQLSNIVKVVSAMDKESLDDIAHTYELVVNAGVYRAESIKVAEAAKIIENSQRDINIAFMNELSIIFNKMGIDTNEVINAASTKWNFLKFYPGLVGGHCIGIDPYYLTYKAETLGYHSQIISAGRRINDDMSIYVAENIIKAMIISDISVKGANIIFYGITFKENCPDTRNSKVVEIVEKVKEYGVNVYIVDPVADKEEAYRLYGVNILEENECPNADCIVLAVAHDEFKNFSQREISSRYKTDNLKKVFIDIKGLYRNSLKKESDFYYWSL